MNPRPIAVALVALALIAVGCQQGGATRLSVAVKPVQLAADSGTMLTLPDDKPFAITEYANERSVAAGGSADCNAGAEASGIAYATTTVADGGTARAMFQLGHALANETDRQLSAELTVALDLTVSTRATPVTGFPDGSLGLDLVIRNRRTRTERVVPLINQTSEHGGAKQQEHRSITVDIQLAPADTLDVYLAGWTHTDSRPEHGVAAELKVENMQLKLTTTAAPAVQTASND